MDFGLFGKWSELMESRCEFQGSEILINHLTLTYTLNVASGPQVRV